MPLAFNYKNKKIMVIDSLGLYPKNYQVDIVLLLNSPRLNLNRMLDSLEPKFIVADGNNYK